MLLLLYDAASGPLYVPVQSLDGATAPVVRLVQGVLQRVALVPLVHGGACQLCCRGRQAASAGRGRLLSLSLTRLLLHQRRGVGWCWWWQGRQRPRGDVTATSVRQRSTSTQPRPQLTQQQLTQPPPRAPPLSLRVCLAPLLSLLLPLAVARVLALLCFALLCFALLCLRRRLGPLPAGGVSRSIQNVLD